MYNLPNNKNIEIAKLEAIFNKYTNSYKFYWFRGIMEEIILGNKEILFKNIVCRIIANMWYPITEFYLNLGTQDKLPEIIKELKIKLNINNDIGVEKVYRILISYDNIDIIVNQITKYVPYRLLQPFFVDSITRQKDALINDIIFKLSNEDSSCMYSIDKNEKKIKINDKWFEYLYENQTIVIGWLDYKLIQFLQSRNPNVPAIPFKLRPPAKRELTRATKLWKYIIENNEIIDIYTDQKINVLNNEKFGDLSIDHFVPWSFVLHDEMWNLIPTFKNINSSKNNRLPADIFIDKFCNLQYTAFCTIIQKKEKAILEEYLNIYNKLDIKKIIEENKNISKEDFYMHLKNTINPLIQIAYNQGYEIWNEAI